MPWALWLPLHSLEQGATYLFRHQWVQAHGSTVRRVQAALALYRMCGFAEVQEIVSQTSSVGSKLGGHAALAQCLRHYFLPVVEA